LIHIYTGASAVLQVDDSYYSTVALNSLRNIFYKVDNALGIVDGYKVTKLFCGSALARDFEGLLKEKSKRPADEKFYIESLQDSPHDIVAPLTSMISSFRVFSVLFFLQTSYGLFEAGIMLIRYIKRLLKKEKINFYIFFSIILSVIASIVRLVVFIDPTGVLTIIDISIARIIYTLQGTIAILSVLLTIFVYIVSSVSSIKYMFIHNIHIYIYIYIMFASLMLNYL
jgi:hypothetical protein